MENQTTVTSSDSVEYFRILNNKVNHIHSLLSPIYVERNFNRLGLSGPELNRIYFAKIVKRK